MSEDLARSEYSYKTYTRLFYPNGEHYQLGCYWAGWATLLDTLCRRLNAILEEVPGASLTVEQVKEKFGGLRFYYTGQGVNAEQSKAIDEAIELAEGASEHICQRCGSPDAEQRASGWIQTLCETCWADPAWRKRL